MAKYLRKDVYTYIVLVSGWLLNSPLVWFVHRYVGSTNFSSQTSWIWKLRIKRIRQANSTIHWMCESSETSCFLGSLFFYHFFCVCCTQHKLHSLKKKTKKKHLCSYQSIGYTENNPPPQPFSPPFFKLFFSILIKDVARKLWLETELERETRRHCMSSARGVVTESTSRKERS